jgi:hypothetical protein
MGISSFKTIAGLITQQNRETLATIHSRMSYLLLFNLKYHLKVSSGDHATPAKTEPVISVMRACLLISRSLLLPVPNGQIQKINSKPDKNAETGI